ncbi:uncharacterized protein SETTUDRAFT_164460 [Exserohilum turcica Et28A]|uniref:Uncharacterized protein n=1 Tax=Exserohilum turcicum (strain 28A) TaxID=671987 RepID=R0K7I8_EXST2|nr:uncharacterized protein SETTUDRAFT_164460 [Exserohilum turcica Et28A]EOA84247.1 hypothetical protein SETTUDRAFT_164460 [Exserohilum turcica Et28A]
MGAGLQRRLAVRLPLRLLSPAMAGHQPMHSPPQETRCPRPCRAVAECKDKMEKWEAVTATAPPRPDASRVTELCPCFQVITASWKPPKRPS